MQKTNRTDRRQSLQKRAVNASAMLVTWAAAALHPGS